MIHDYSFFVASHHMYLQALQPETFLYNGSYCCVGSRLIDVETSTVIENRSAVYIASDCP
jgi:hypothetical protein